MRIQASLGKFGRRKKVGLFQLCGRLTLTADNPDKDALELEGEMLSRLYREVRAGNTGYLLKRLRTWQKKEDIT